MTDNDIIKAAACCIKDDCENCPYFANGIFECGEHFNKDVFNLINRQKAEIEKLREHIELLNIEHEAIEISAIKKFAERLKAHTRKMSSSDFSGEFWDKAVLVSDINNLVKKWQVKAND